MQHKNTILTKKNSFKGKLQSKDKPSQAKPKGHKIEEKEGKERAITNPNAPIGLHDIQPQSQEPKQR